MARGTIGSTTYSRRALLRGSAAASAASAASVGLAGVPAASALGAGAPRPARRRPNVVVISFDDLAWNDFGCYGNQFHETPHIDRLAARGMRFTQAYSAAPVCSPTRAALVTGLYPARTGITDFLRAEAAPSDRYLDPRLSTIPEQVAGRGYHSALVGKWHLTEDYSGPYRTRRGNPYAHGFDTVKLSEEQYIGHGDMFFPYRFMPSVTRGKDREYLTERMAADTAEWIGNHARTPFFLHVSNYAIHYKWRAKAALVRKYERKKRRNPEFQEDRYRPVIAAMVEHCDRQVGRIVRALDDAGIAENTLVLVTSDNGGAVPSSIRPLRGRKGSLYEGGIRVPLVAFWPGTVPAGTTSDAVVSTVDIAPTVKDLADAGGWSGLDGVSLAGVLIRQEGLSRSTFWYYPHHFAGEVPSAAVRSGRHKLIRRLRTGAVELYDVVDDPRESHDLARRKPRLARKLNRQLGRHIREVRRVPDAPTSEEYPTLATRADPADTGHEVLRLAGTATTERRGGRLVVSSAAPAQVLLRSPLGPTSDHFAVTLDPGLARVAGDPRPTPRGEDPRVAVGLAKDADNHLTVTYDHARRTVRWALVTGGVDRTGAGEPEDLGALDGTVDLSAPGSRLGMSVDGASVGVYADQGTGQGWEFLFLVDVGGSVPLADPRARRGWRYAVGVGLDGGAQALGGYEVRER